MRAVRCHAQVVQDLFGGEILKSETPSGVHFYHRIEGKRQDVTASQFDRPIAFNDTPSNREEALSDTSLAQYAALKAPLLRCLNTPRA